MNKIFNPKIYFKDIVSEEAKIKSAYSKLFEIARNNILEKRMLTDRLSHKYTDIQYGRNVFDC